MTAAHARHGFVHFNLVQPRGDFFVGRSNQRVWCEHGEIVWSTPGDESAYRAQAIERLHERTGCECRDEREATA